MPPNEGADFVSVRIGEKLARLFPSPSESCIFKVHRELRGVNEKAYEPEIIAIGPYHHGNARLQVMEEHKLRYLQLLLQRRNESNAEKFVVALRSLEQESRRCYAEPVGLNGDEMIEMMLLDGCFIIELIRKFDMAYLRDKHDPIFKMDWIVNSLQRDLMLFENQLPFFVLCKLFDMIEVPGQHNRFIFLALRFFRDLLPGSGYSERDGNSQDKIKQIRHLLGLIHNNWLPSFAGLEEPNGGIPNKKGKWRFIPNITKLREAGVRLEKVEGGSLFDIKFKSGVLQIPPLTIEDRTESLFRNLIAYEQYCPDNQLRHIIDYVRFVDCLVDSPKDVEILCRHGIIDNWLGDDEVVSTCFNKIGNSITGLSGHFQYADIFNEVNVHCSKRWNHWMAILRRNYLNSPWAVLSIFAASLLILLTVTQTIFTVFPR